MWRRRRRVEKNVFFSLVCFFFLFFFLLSAFPYLCNFISLIARILSSAYRMKRRKIRVKRERETERRQKGKKKRNRKKNVPFLHSLEAAAIAVPSLFIVQVTHRVKGKGGLTRLGGRGSKVGEAARKGEKFVFSKKKRW